MRLLKVPKMIPIEGGLPIIHDGRVIGGVGVSGATAQQDGQIAQACLSALQ
ncbi:MAG: GlcG/HbpS family heme-binding protein [Candidatus Binatia bacterium]